MNVMRAHIPQPDPLQNPTPTDPLMPPALPGQDAPIDEPPRPRDPPVKDPPPDERPNPKRY